MAKARWYGSINNRIMEGIRIDDGPAVGMGGTVLMWSDRNPVTVSKILSSHRIEVTPDRVTKWKDEYGVEFETVADAQPMTLRLCKDGAWRIEKDPARTVVALGKREAYRDRSF